MDMAERWGTGLVAAIGAAAGGISGAVTSLISGGDQLAAGTLAGVVVGAAVATVLWLVARRGTPSMAGDQRNMPASFFTPDNPPPEVPTADVTAQIAAPGARVRTTTDVDALVNNIASQWNELVTRQLEILDELRHDPYDDERMDAAFRLGLRSRRKATNLVVLADDEPDGAFEPTRFVDVGEGVTVADVLDRALSDNDRTDRVDTSSLHHVLIAGDAAEDVAHLMAELIDNAVGSSEEAVTVLGRWVRDGYVLSVVDEGAGMTTSDRDEANRRLAHPPSLADAHPGAFGLTVAGRLAARHGIAVQLLESATDGIIAKIRLPALIVGRTGSIDDEGQEQPVPIAPYDIETYEEVGAESVRHDEGRREVDSWPDPDPDPVTDPTVRMATHHEDEDAREAVGDRSGH